MRNLCVWCVLVATVAVTNVANAQSTISDRPFDLNASGGLWAPLLPTYELGTNSGGLAIRDRLDDVGGIVQLETVRRWLWTRTGFEAKGFYGAADSFAKSGNGAVTISDPVTGADRSLTAGETQLRSEVRYFGGDIGLSDTWQTRFGGLSAGALISYMQFDQDFDVSHSATRLFDETLKSKFRGGKATFGWENICWDIPTDVDVAVGFFDLNADYGVVNRSAPGQSTANLQKVATTFESSVTVRKCFHEMQVGLTFGVMYISDMPRIRHDFGAPASLVFDDAVTLTGLIELLLL